MLTQSRLQEVLNYDPDTGVFTRLVRTSNSIKIGDVAGNVAANGYRDIKIEGKRYYAHRLAWLYVYGVWPEHQLDHVNGIRADNRWDNLREATNAENAQNQTLRNTNTSGYMGVHWHGQRKKWVAQIMIAESKKHLGLFATPESAHYAYVAAKAQLHEFNPVQRSN